MYCPPSEAGSLIIRATIRCLHNRCALWAICRGVSFGKRPLAEVIEDLDLALEAYGPEARRTSVVAGGAGRVRSAPRRSCGISSRAARGTHRPRHGWR
ncbi:MAG: hypothetical protein C3F15_07705 [Holophagae bacterium]|nr:MAG: hypothetical protein C3F15_07705 [Holophagae bacterium]